MFNLSPLSHGGRLIKAVMPQYKFNMSPQTQKNLSWFQEFQRRQASMPSKGFGLGKFLSPITQIATNALQNYFNYKTTQSNNERQERIAAEANELTRQESEKAFQRSRPLNQVAEMRLAGMSEAGAINALNGGGSYTPAAVNTAQTQAPQLDFSAAINALQASADLSERKRQFDVQMQEQQRQFDKSHELAKDNQEFEQKRVIENDAYDSIIKTFQAAKLDAEAKSANLDWMLKYFTQDERLDTEKKRLLAEKANYLANAIRDKLLSDGLNDIDPDTLQMLFKYQSMLEMVSNIGNMTIDKAMSIIHDIKEIFIPG